MASETRDIQKHVLPNGLVVITETMPHVRSVSVGVWVRNGSRREVPEENGLAHFMEHMVFKGTERRSAEAIAREMDSIGGMLDAFTSKEQICFNAKVLDEHLPIAFDIIADLVLRPKFDSEDVKKERQVVLEEIKMDLDNPEYLLHEIFTRGFWPQQSSWRRHVLAPFSEYSRKAGSRLCRFQRADALLRRRNDDRLRRHRQGDRWPGHRSDHPGISRFEGIAGYGRRASPFKKSPQGFADALARVHQLAHVQSRAPGALFWSVLHARRNSGLHRSRHPR